MNQKNLIQKAGIILFFFFIFIFFLRPIDSDGDFFQHVNIGRSVVTNAALPYLDDFTFTSLGKPFIGYAWGTGVIFYLLYSNLGPLGVNIFIALIAFITFILLYSWLRLYKISHVVILPLLTFAAGVISTRWLTRPEIITYPFVISFFLIDLLKKKHPRIVFLFPILTLVWANMYGNSLFVGLFFLCVIGIKQFLKDKKFVPNQKLFFVCIFTSIPLSLLNGYGFDSLLFITLIPRMAHIFGDWANLLDVLTRTSVDVLLVYQYRVLLYLLYLFAFVLVVLLSLKRLKKYPFEVFLALFIFLPFGAFRQYPLAILLALPLFSLLIQEMKSKQKIILGSIFCFALYSLFISNWINRIGIGENIQTFPPEIIQFIKKNDLKGRIFNTQQLGAFLTYHLYPNSRVFSDTRDELFLDNSPLMHVETTFSRNQSILPILDTYKVNYAVVNLAEGGASYRSLFYSQHWVPVYGIGSYMVVIPRQEAEKKHLNILDAIDPFSLTGSKEGRLQDSTIQYENLENLTLSTLSLLAAGNTEKAIEQAQKIQEWQGPRSVFQKLDKNYLLAQAYLQKKDCLNAKHHLDLIDQMRKGKLIFSPFTPLSSHLYKGLASFSLICANDKEKAKMFLDQYFKENRIGVMQRVEIMKEIFSR